MKDGKKILTTPISAEDLKDIHIGDIVYLNGSMTTCRDVAHRRLVEEGRELPVDVRDAAIFHAGPIIRPLENDKFEMVSVGPTTSMRMEKFEKEFIKETGVKLIIGKGGMGPNTMEACQEHKALHAVFPGGCAAAAADQIAAGVGSVFGGDRRDPGGGAVFASGAERECIPPGQSGAGPDPSQGSVPQH